VEGSFETYAFVVIARQDTIFSELRGPSLIADMVKEGDTMTFPFKCSADSWSKWQCVADTVMAIPAHRVKPFRKCMCVIYKCSYKMIFVFVLSFLFSILNISNMSFCYAKNK
jgi:hypothetical protein